MKTVSARFPSEVIQKIEWLHVFLYERDSIRFSTTQIIIMAVNKLYYDLRNQTLTKDGQNNKMFVKDEINE